MTHPFVERFRERDPSLGLAVASILRCMVRHGSATFATLAASYRDEHIAFHRDQIGHTAPQGGGGRDGGGDALSLDEARRHLANSTLPRLVNENVLEPLPDTLEDDTPIRLQAAELEGIRDDLTAVTQQLIEVVRANLHDGESAVQTSSSPPTPPTPPPNRTGESQLTAHSLTKVYRKRAVVDNVDLSVKQGEIVGLLGPNGAGKTTSFYMIVGLIRPDKGEISLDGENISQLPMYQRARRGIGYLSQEPSVFRKLTVEDNVQAILETLKLTSDERNERTDALLDDLSIKHLRKVPAYKLSGGERRRLEITRALVTRPRFMLLDEPFAGVDPIAVHDIQTIVTGLRQRGIGVLITDHNVEQTLDIVDRAYIMFEGTVHVSGTVRELVFNDQVADLYLGPTLTARLRQRLESAA